MHAASLVRLDSRPLPFEKAADAAALPSRLKLLSWGANPSSKGTWILNDTTVAQLPKNQTASNFDRVALDFNHNSVPGSESYKGEPVLVAAHGTPLLIPGDGLYLDQLEWTAEGRQFVGGRHYIDLSPTILPNKKGEVLFLHSAAVCRQGAVTGLSILSAENPALRFLQTLTTTPTDSMDYKSLVCTLLGLSADATDADIETAAKAFAKKDSKETEMVANAAAAVRITELSTKIETSEATIKSLTDRLGALETNAATAAIDAVKAEAAAAGKVIPAEVLAGPVGKDAAQLKALAASLPSTVPMDQRTHAVRPATVDLVTNSAGEAVRKQLGFTAEEWAKLGN